MLNGVVVQNTADTLSPSVKKLTQHRSSKLHQTTILTLQSQQQQMKPYKTPQLASDEKPKVIVSESPSIKMRLTQSNFFKSNKKKIDKINT